MRAVKPAMRQRGESIGQLYYRFENEAEQAEDSKTLLAFVHFSHESHCYGSVQARDAVISSLCNL